MDARKSLLKRFREQKKDRPELNAMLQFLRQGDQCVVVKLDRIGRNTKHLIELSETFKSMGVDFVSIGDSIDTSSATGKLFFSIMASIAQFEADFTREKTLEGLAAARKRGRVGGRPKADPEMVDRALKMYRAKTFCIREITQATGLSKASIYRYVKQDALQDEKKF